jgi:hypothetical protein
MNKVLKFYDFTFVPKHVGFYFVTDFKKDELLLAVWDGKYWSFGYKTLEAAAAPTGYQTSLAGINQAGFQDQKYYWAAPRSSFAQDMYDTEWKLSDVIIYKKQSNYYNYKKKHLLVTPEMVEALICPALADLEAPGGMDSWKDTYKLGGLTYLFQQVCNTLGYPTTGIAKSVDDPNPLWKPTLKANKFSWVLKDGVVTKTKEEPPKVEKVVDHNKLNEAIKKYKVSYYQQVMGSSAGWKIVTDDINSTTFVEGDF